MKLLASSQEGNWGRRGRAVTRVLPGAELRCLTRAGVGRLRRGDLPAWQRLRTEDEDFPEKRSLPYPLPQGKPYLDQSQDVTAVRGSGWTDLKFSHFRLLLFFPLRTRPLYLNSRRRWFLIRFPGASSSQSGWHHDPANLSIRQKTGKLTLGKLRS